MPPNAAFEPVPSPFDPPPQPPTPPAPLPAVRTRTRTGDADVLRRFGALLRAARNRRALSQAELGYRSKVHRTHISLAECGHRDVRLTTICAIAAALHVPPATLMPG